MRPVDASNDWTVFFWRLILQHPVVDTLIDEVPGKPAYHTATFPWRIQSSKKGRGFSMKLCKNHKTSKGGKLARPSHGLKSSPFYFLD